MPPRLRRARRHPGARGAPGRRRRGAGRCRRPRCHPGDRARRSAPSRRRACPRRARVPRTIASMSARCGVAGDAQQHERRRAARSARVERDDRRRADLRVVAVARADLVKGDPLRSWGAGKRTAVISSSSSSAVSFGPRKNSRAAIERLAALRARLDGRVERDGDGGELGPGRGERERAADRCRGAASRDSRRTAAPRRSAATSARRPGRRAASAAARGRRRRARRIHPGRVLAAGRALIAALRESTWTDPRPGPSSRQMSDSAGAALSARLDALRLADRALRAGFGQAPGDPDGAAALRVRGFAETRPCSCTGRHPERRAGRASRPLQPARRRTRGITRLAGGFGACDPGIPAREHSHATFLCTAFALAFYMSSLHAALP